MPLTLRDHVFQALDNSVENGFDVEDPTDEALYLLDQCSAVSDHFGVSDKYPGDNDPKHVAEVAAIVEEWKELRP